MDKFIIKRSAGDTDQENHSSKFNKVPKRDDKQTAADGTTESKFFGPKPQSASVKTVRKWEKELGVGLDYEVSQTDANQVVQIWCTVCRNHSRDKTSSVRYFFIFC